MFKKAAMCFINREYDVLEFHNWIQTVCLDTKEQVDFRHQIDEELDSIIYTVPDGEQYSAGCKVAQIVIDYCDSILLNMD